MEGGATRLSHQFEVASDVCTLKVDLPFLSSLEGVELDVGSEAVRLGLPGETAGRLIAWPAEVEGRLDMESSSAKFSKRNAQLIVTMKLHVTEKAARCQSDPTAELASGKCSAPAAEQQLGDQRVQGIGTAALASEKCSAPAAEQQLGDQKVQGSGWNVNSWHWEERPMIKWSQTWFDNELSASSFGLLDGLAECRFLDTAQFLKGDVSLCVRKGRPVVLYEFGSSSGFCRCRWEVMPNNSENEKATGFAKGTLWVKDWNSEDGAEEGPDLAVVEFDATIDTSKGRCFSKALRDKGVSFMRSLLKKFLKALVNTAALPQDSSKRSD